MATAGHTVRQLMYVPHCSYFATEAMSKCQLLVTLSSFLND